MAVVRVVGVDGAVAEVADEEVAAEAAEAGGGDGQAPRRVELAVTDQMLLQHAVAAEHVDEAVPGPEASTPVVGSNLA